MSIFTRALCTKKRGNSALIIGNAIFWAAAMLLAAWFRIGPTDNKMMMPGLLTACWFAAQAFIQGHTPKCGN